MRENIQSLLQLLFMATLISGYVIPDSQKLSQNGFFIGKAFHQQTKNQVIVKIIPKIEPNTQLIKESLKQAHILKQIKHQNIVALQYRKQTTNYYYIFYQFWQMNLRQQLNQEKKFSEAKSIQILKQISKGLLTLAKAGIIHRNLMPESILISKGIYKIGDFRLAKQTYNINSQNIRTLEPSVYKSPQILNQQSYTFKSDIWSIGIIFYQLLHGYTPWPQLNNAKQLLIKIKTQQVAFRSDLSQKTKKFILHCLKLEQEQRITLEQYFSHELFSGFFKFYQIEKTLFQSKFLTFMKKLRIQVSEKELNVERIFTQLGYTNPLQKIQLKRLSDFFLRIDPNISQVQIIDFFQKLDYQKKGYIQLQDLRKEFAQFNVLSSKAQKVTNKKNNQQPFEKIRQLKKPQKIDIHHQKYQQEIKDSMPEYSMIQSHSSYRNNQKIKLQQKQELFVADQEEQEDRNNIQSDLDYFLSIVQKSKNTKFTIPNESPPTVPPPPQFLQQKNKFKK